jgi:hypothetical protein
MSAERRGFRVKYGRTSESKETLAYQCAVRLLRGESPNTVRDSLLSRGVGEVDKIMDLAEEYCR